MSYAELHPFQERNKSLSESEDLLTKLFEALEPFQKQVSINQLIMPRADRARCLLAVVSRDKPVKHSDYADQLKLVKFHIHHRPSRIGISMSTGKSDIFRQVNIPDNEMM